MICVLEELGSLNGCAVFFIVCLGVAANVGVVMRRCLLKSSKSSKNSTLDAMLLSPSASETSSQKSETTSSFSLALLDDEAKAVLNTQMMFGVLSLLLALVSAIIYVLFFTEEDCTLSFVFTYVLIATGWIHALLDLYKLHRDPASFLFLVWSINQVIVAALVCVYYTQFDSSTSSTAAADKTPSIAFSCLLFFYFVASLCSCLCSLFRDQLGTLLVRGSLLASNSSVSSFPVNLWPTRKDSSIVSENSEEKFYEVRLGSTDSEKDGHSQDIKQHWAAGTTSSSSLSASSTPRSFASHSSSPTHDRLRKALGGEELNYSIEVTHVEVVGNNIIFTLFFPSSSKSSRIRYEELKLIRIRLLSQHPNSNLQALPIPDDEEDGLDGLRDDIKIFLNSLVRQDRIWGSKLYVELRDR